MIENINSGKPKTCRAEGLSDCSRHNAACCPAMGAPAQRGIVVLCEFGGGCRTQSSANWKPEKSSMQDRKPTRRQRRGGKYTHQRLVKNYGEAFASPIESNRAELNCGPNLYTHHPPSQASVQSYKLDIKDTSVASFPFIFNNSLGVSLYAVNEQVPGVKLHVRMMHFSPSHCLLFSKIFLCDMRSSKKQTISPMNSVKNMKC
jgi:hypothetical protein